MLDAPAGAFDAQSVDITTLLTIIEIAVFRHPNRFRFECNGQKGQPQKQKIKPKPKRTLGGGAGRGEARMREREKNEWNGMEWKNCPYQN